MARLTPEMRERRAELLQGVVRVVTTALREQGLGDDAVADQTGHAVADYLAEEWGGQVISYPKDMAYRLAARELEILEAHRNGASLASLVDRYKITLRALHRLLRRAEARGPKRDQMALPFG